MKPVRCSNEMVKARSALRMRGKVLLRCQRDEDEDFVILKEHYSRPSGGRDVATISMFGFLNALMTRWRLS